MNATYTPTVKATLGLLLAQSRILRALAYGTVLQGTPAELIDRLEIGPDVFRAALQDLVEGGWVFVTTKDDRMIVGRERRCRNAGPPRRGEQRTATSLWEGTGIALAR